MYLKLSKFLLSHQHLNMSKVPGFYQFFFSSDFEVCVGVQHRVRDPSLPTCFLGPPLCTAPAGVCPWH